MVLWAVRQTVDPSDGPWRPWRKRTPGRPDGLHGDCSGRGQRHSQGTGSRAVRDSARREPDDWLSGARDGEHAVCGAEAKQAGWRKVSPARRRAVLLRPLLFGGTPAHNRLRRVAGLPFKGLARAHDRYIAEPCLSPARNQIRKEIASERQALADDLATLRYKLLRFLLLPVATAVVRRKSKGAVVLAGFRAIRKLV